MPTGLFDDIIQPRVPNTGLFSDIVTGDETLSPEEEKSVESNAENLGTWLRNAKVTPAQSRRAALLAGASDFGEGVLRRLADPLGYLANLPAEIIDRPDLRPQPIISPEQGKKMAQFFNPLPPSAAGSGQEGLEQAAGELLSGVTAPESVLAMGTGSAAPRIFALQAAAGIPAAAERLRAAQNTPEQIAAGAALVFNAALPLLVGKAVQPRMSRTEPAPPLRDIPFPGQMSEADADLRARKIAEKEAVQAEIDQTEPAKEPDALQDRPPETLLSPLQKPAAESQGEMPAPESAAGVQPEKPEKPVAKDRVGDVSGVDPFELLSDDFHSAGFESQDSRGLPSRQHADEQLGRRTTDAEWDTLERIYNEGVAEAQKMDQPEKPVTKEEAASLADENKVVPLKSPETRLLNRQFGTLPKGTEVTLTGEKGGELSGGEVGVILPDGTKRMLPASWLKSHASAPKESLGAMVTRLGRTEVERLIGEWDSEAELSPDGKTIDTVIDPRNKSGKTKGSIRDFQEWLNSDAFKKLESEKPDAVKPALAQAPAAKAQSQVTKVAKTEGQRSAKEKAALQSKPDTKAAQEQEQPGLLGTGPGIVGMGAAIQEEFESNPKTATGIKNATVDQEREQRGLPPAIQPLRKTFGAVWDKAMAIVDRDPGYQDRLIQQLRENPRALTDEEDALLLHRQVDLQNEYGKATRDLAQAFDDGRTEDVANEKIRVAELSDRLLDLYNINKKVGTETGRGLNARKMMAYEDFSLAKMEMDRRAIRGGAPLTDAERIEISRLQKQIEESQKVFDSYQAQTAQKLAEMETRAVMAEVGRQAAEQRASPAIISVAERLVRNLDTRADAARARMRERLGRTSAGVDPTVLLDVAEIGASHIGHIGLDFAKWSAKMIEDVGDWVKDHLQEVWEASQKVINDLEAPAAAKTQIRRERATVEELKTDISSKLSEGKLDGVTGAVQKLVRRFAEQGVNDMHTMIDMVWDTLKESNPEITRREAMDAISGYGKFKQLSKDEISVRVRDLKGQMQQVAKLEDMQKGQAPAKTGVERRSPSDTERRLIKQVNEAKKKGGFVVTDPARQLASALTARKNYYRNRLADLREEIDKREKLVKQKAAQPTDAQLDALKAEYRQVVAEHEQVFPKQPLTEEQRIAAASKGLDREIASLEAAVKSGDVLPKKGKSQPSSPELDAKRAQLQALREQRNELRDLNQEFQQQKATKAIDQQRKDLQANIAEKERKLREGDLTAKGQPINRPASPELESLKQQRDAINKRLAEARKKPEAVRLAEQLQKRLETMNKVIAAKEAKIAAGDASTTARPVNRPLASPELEAAQQKMDALNKQLADMRKSTKTPEERALQSYKTRLATQYAELQAKLAAGDFTTRPRRNLTLDAEAMRLKARNERLKDQWLQAQETERLKNRTWWEKTLDWGTLYRRAGVLSSPLVIPKLISAGLQRLTSLPLEDLVGSGFRRVPGLSDVAGKAPLEGGGTNLRSEVKGWKGGFTAGMKDAYQVLKTGKSDLDVLYGDGLSYSGEGEFGGRVLTFFGRLHGMLKAPVKRAAFERAVERLGEHYGRASMPLADPLMDVRIGMEAYKYANKQIFLDDNMIASKISAFLSEKVSKETGHATLGSKIWATAGRIALPIVRVPTNIVAETLQYAAGLASGGTRLGFALARGIENLRPEQADLIMSELKKGAVGGAVLLVGYFNAQAIGGYYQPGKKRQPDDVKAGSIRVYGHDVPSWLLHNPLLETLQIGATMRRVADSRLRRKDMEDQGIGAGALAATVGVVEEVPFVHEMLELDKLANPNKRSGFIGEQIKSILVPSIVQKTAQWLDRNDIKRTPSTVIEHIETGVPGLRTRVPEKYQAP